MNYNNTFKELEKRRPIVDTDVFHGNIIIPKDYRQFIEDFNVAVPEKDLFIISGINCFRVEYFLGISNNEDYNIYSVNEFYFGRIPSNMIAIAKIYGSNLLCYETNTGNIYYWNHDVNECDNGIGVSPILVAKSLREFIEALGYEREIDISNHDFEIISIKYKPGWEKLFQSKKE